MVARQENELNTKKVSILFLGSGKEVMINDSLVIPLKFEHILQSNQSSSEKRII